MASRRGAIDRRSSGGSIVASTRAYERWLRRQMPLLRVDLRERHRLTAQSAFAFLRGSFFRWAEVFPHCCPELLAAPNVLGVGDLHVENFGTWRAADGELCWGVNDFDEVATLPYTNDLVRLAASALLTTGKNGFALRAEEICEALLEGYRNCLERGGSGIRITRDREWARSLLSVQPSQVEKFWQRLGVLPDVRGAVSPETLRALTRDMPESATELRFVHRQGGLGSLGRPRFTAVARVRQTLVAREAKRLSSSAWNWRDNTEGAKEPRSAQLVRQIVRIRDPSLRFIGPWVIKRLAPDAQRIEMRDLPGKKHHRKLLVHMGWDTANVHLGTRRQRRRILADLERRNADWLLGSAVVMRRQTRKDWREWQASSAQGKEPIRWTTSAQRST